MGYVGTPGLYGVGNAMSMYMNVNKGSTPAKDKWCDLLIQYSDVTPQCFKTYNSDYIDGETTFVLNSTEINDASPAELVMAFDADLDTDGQSRDYPIEQRGFMQTDENGYFNHLKGTKVYKDRWNISGGPELLTIKPGCHYYPILFCDTRVMPVKLDKLASLCWDTANTDYSHIIQPKIDQANQALTNAYQQVWIIIASLAAFVLLSVWRLPIPRPKIGKLIAFTIFVSFLGWGLGSISYLVHMSFHESGLGSLLGLSSGILLAIWYYAVISNIPGKIKNSPVLVLWTVLPASLCGAVSSGLIHGIIVTLTGESFLEGILPGLLFGILVGSIIGLITTFFIKPEDERKAEPAPSLETE